LGKAFTAISARNNSLRILVGHQASHYSGKEDEGRKKGSKKKTFRGVGAINLRGKGVIFKGLELFCEGGSSQGEVKKAKI